MNGKSGFRPIVGVCTSSPCTGCGKCKPNFEGCYFCGGKTFDKEGRCDSCGNLSPNPPGQVSKGLNN